MRFSSAIVRRPAENFADGLTSSELGAANYEFMRVQHEAYIGALREAGLSVEILDAAPQYPDAHFVEDEAVVVPEVAVITRPGAKQRRGEEALIEPTLANHRPIARIEAPGTLDGGDVLQIGRNVFIGVSARTNKVGARQLETLLSRHGYRCTLIPLTHTLHLKSDLNAVGSKTVVVTQALAAHEAIEDYERILVSPEETYAANLLRINDRLLIAKGFPRLRERLDATGLEITELNMSEVRKMDGGLTCLSVRL
jgi:dimethylargininase